MNDPFVEVNIFEEKYKLVSSYKDQEKIVKISKMVNDRMDSLSKRFPAYSKTKIAILTSLNFADELFKLYSDQDKANEKVDTLINIIEQSLPSSE